MGMPIACGTCHYDSASPPSWTTDPTTTDNTYFNNLCKSCHNTGGSLDPKYVVKTHSSGNMASGKYQPWTIECRVCHNPHYQDQISSYPTDTNNNLFTGTIFSYVQVAPTATYSTIKVTAPGLAANDWIDYMFVPNTLYPTKMYRILSNTADSFTVIGSINGRYALPGSTFGVRLSSLLLAQLRTPFGVVESVKFYTDDPSKPDSYASSTNPANVTGICQVCHTQTKSFNRTGVTGSIQEGPNHPAVVASGQKCAGCHIHTKGFKGECNSCHGYPPNSVSSLITLNKSGGSVSSDSGSGPGAHVLHIDSLKLVCANCHADGMLSGQSAGDDRINIKFDYLNGITTGSYDGKAGRSVYPYTGAATGNTYRCSNIYCHSSGQGSTSLKAAPVYAQPQWNVPSSGACGTCHGRTSATLTTGNHAQHLGYAAAFVGCGDCHTGAADDASAYGSTNHINTSIDVANGYTASGAAGNGYGTCGSAAACHGAGTPRWGMNTTGQDKCTLCHGTPTAGTLGSSGANMAPPLDTAQSTSSTKVGAHQAHLRTNTIAAPVPCQECHIVPASVNDPGHIKDGTPGVAEVDFTNAATANFNGAVPRYAAGACSLTYCHGAAMPKSTTAGAGRTPSWSDANYINGDNSHDCAQCHGFPPSTINAHLTSTGLPLGPNSCSSCHSNTSASATGFVDVALHINKILEVQGCNACHGNSGPTGAPLVPADLVSPATGHAVGMHPKHVASLNYTCSTCHDGNTMPVLDSTLTMSFRPGPLALPAGGAYAGITLNAPYKYSSNVTITNGAQQTCSNLYCHGATMAPSGGTDTTPNWANAATGACGSCHGATAANPPTRGNHAVHAASYSGSGYQVACTLCHVNYAIQHVDGLSQVAFNTGDGRVSSATYTGTTTMLDGYGGCTGVYCHSQGTKTTPPYGAPNVAPMWGNTLDCAGCHGGAVGQGTMISTNAHSAHINDGAKNKASRSFSCAECHHATVSSNTLISNYLNHVNQLVNIKFNTNSINKNVDGPTYEGQSTTITTGASVTAGMGGNVCSNVYCHSIGNLSSTDPNTNTVVSIGVLSFRTPTWNPAGGLSCDACHGDQAGKAYPTYATGSAGSTTANSHLKHLEGSGHTCNICHVTTTVSTTITAATMTLVPGGTHLNRVEDVNFVTMAAKTGVYNPGKTCSSTYCHGTGPSPAWGGATNCDSCHGASNTGLSGRHDVHFNTTSTATAISATNAHTNNEYVYGCGNCHPSGSHATGPVSSTAPLQDAQISLAGAITSYTSGGTSSVDPRGFNFTVISPGSCVNKCHTDGKGGPPRANVDWTTTTQIMCNRCHNGPRDGSRMWTLPHDRHTVIYNDPNTGTGNVNMTCGSCHAGTALSYYTLQPTGREQHPNQNVDVAMNSYAGGTSVIVSGAQGSQTCANTYCHSNGTAPSGTHSAISWTGSTTCTSCHGNPPNYVNGTPKANSHLGHNYNCSKCHVGTTSTGTTITDYSKHVNKAYDVLPGTGISFTYAFASPGGSCSNISCHPGSYSNGQWGATACLDCHAVSQGSRAAVAAQFGGNSHHVQGVALSNAHCYQCHWEANSDGSINPAYHGGSAAPGSPVNLVIYQAGSRPTLYTPGSTAMQYSADGSRAQIANITPHCLGCHSDQNNNAQPFGDGKTPRQYAWDGTSVALRYSQTGTTTWGKYSTSPNAAQKNITKAYSAHGNLIANQRGWNATTGVDGPITDTGGNVNVQCFDCHNAHGSAISGVTTRYSSATVNGGILKDTTAGVGGYSMTYKPQSGGTAAGKNIRNAGASLCLDCHLNQNAGAMPWGYGSTFGATQPVLGYFDTPYFGPGTFGSQMRYLYKAALGNMGGHFGTSSPLSSMPSGSIDGLCTPCHDPHGVSPTLGADAQYAVPLLKGTFLTSPYREDAAPAYNQPHTALGEGPGYHIDQNTFSSGTITQSEGQFAGLCLTCHTKSSLTNGADHTWRSKDRIHESVKGWKTANGTIQHSYTCSKCHSPHNSSLPRLTVSNCLNATHKGRVSANPSPVISGSGNGYAQSDMANCFGSAYGCGEDWSSYGSGSGSGRFPGAFSSSGTHAPGTQLLSCHEGNTGNVAEQGWNNKTPWSNITPVITAGPAAYIGDQMVLLHMDEASWNGTANEVRDSSGANNHGTAYYAANVAGGVSGRAGTFNGTYDRIIVGYSPPADNFTVEAWIKPTTTHEIDAESVSGTGGTYGQRYVFGADHRAADGGAGISAGSNGISVYEHGEGYMPALAVYSGAVSTTQWTHVAVVYSNKQPSIYVNGILVRTGLQSTRPHVYAPTWIGGGAYGYFPGMIDEVSIYSKALNGTDIMSHYQKSSATVCNTSDARIIWTTSFDATSYVDYGLTTSYGTTAGDGSLVKNHAIPLSGLTVGDTYHFRVRSSNTDGQAVSGDSTFTMSACPLMVPILVSPTATAIGSSTAVLGADLSSDGGTSITERGTVWGASPNPTVNALAEGGTATGAFSHARAGLTTGTKIYYRAYAINSSGTGYSPDGSFYTEPSAQASAVGFAGVGQTSMTVNWTRGTGDGAIVLMRAGSPVNSDPVDGTYTGYAANPAFGSGTQIGTGNYVISKGTGTTVTVTGLNGGVTYYVAVYEYKGAADTSGVNQGTNYKPSPATGSQITNAPTAPVLTSPTAVFVTSTTATLGATITSSGGTVLTARGTCWGASAAPTANCIAEGGTGTGVFTQARTGLPAGTQLYYRGYATNSAGTGYSPDGSFFTEPATQASLVSFSSVTLTSMTVSWTRGSGDGALVLMRQGSAVNADPADGVYTGYSANAAFGSGTQIGAGNFVISQGTGTSAAVTGLTAGTTYYVAVYEYRGMVDTSGVNQGTNYKPSPATGSQMASIGPGSYSYTFNYTGVVEYLTIPAGATNIQFTVKGAGGGGGRPDNVGNQQDGQNGHLVTRTSTTSGITLSVYVGAGGTEGSTSDGGSPGGWGYQSGGYGGNGEYWDSDCWAFGGAGGGGSSAIFFGATRIVEAVGGAGGRSSDFEDTYWGCYNAGGSGGSGGGLDFPNPGSTGGGVGGLSSIPSPGGSGQVVISYDVLSPTTPVLTSPTATAVTITTATVGANTTNNGGTAIIERGTCWNNTSPVVPVSGIGNNCAAEGGTALGVFTHARTGLNADSIIYYRGYATNSTDTGYSPEASFYTEPSTQASAINFTGVGQTGMTVNWTRGSGDGVIVLMRSGSAVNADPSDGTYAGYTANSAFGTGAQVGTGNYVVYKGSGTSVAVTGLAALSTYYVAVYEYKGIADTVGVNQGANYKPSPATGSQITIMPATVTSPTATAIATTTATLGATITSSGGGAITSRGTCWSTSAAPTINCLAEGGTGTGVFTQGRTGLASGARIYYRGYAINGAGTAYSPDGSFFTEPSTQASLVSFSSVSLTSMTVSWTRGNGDGVIVLMRQGAAVDADPADGTYTGYTANAAFGGGTQVGTGNYVLYRGTGSSVAVTGLTAGTAYYVAVYEFKGTVNTVGVNQGVNYRSAPAAGNQSTSAPVLPTLAAPTSVVITTTTATLGATITSNGGGALTSRGTCWGASAAPTANCIAAGGTGTGVFTHARTGLPAGTQLYYRGFATNITGTGYSPDGSFHTEPLTQASLVSFSSVSTTSMTISWTRGSGDGAIVLMKQGSSVSADPLDGTFTGYAANAVFGSGTQIGMGNFVVSKGTGTTVTVTGLIAGMTYYAAVYEYAGTADTSGVNQGSNYKPSPATGSQSTSVVTGSHSYTFNYTGAVQTLSLPFGATNIQFTVKGAGGGGGRPDNVWNQENGQNGHLVTRSYSTSGVTLSIYVGAGGTEGSPSDGGSPGGWGYQFGEYGGNGDYYDFDCYAFGGAGGGGSSAIFFGATRLAEAAGGAGGRSSDWSDWCYASGGPGGAGGGSDYPLPGTTAGGAGGAGVDPPTAGGNGQVVVTYDILSPTTPALTSPTAAAVATTTATLGANITGDGGTALVARGACWNTTSPVVNVGGGGNNCADEGGTALGVFTHARTGLPAGSIIYYKAYASNSTDTGYSSEGSFSTEPSIQASLITFSSVVATGMSVTWTRGDGDGVIVLMRSGSAVDSDPADGTYAAYTANPAFGSGTQIGTGNFVIYKGTGSSVAVTGLTAGTTYYVAAYEFKGVTDTVDVNQGTNYKPSPATGSLTMNTPTTPVLIGQPNSVCASTCGQTLQWNASTNPLGDPLEYLVEVDTVSTFNSAGKQSSGWISATSWTVTLSTESAYYWRVIARDTLNPVFISTWSAPGSFILTTGAIPPAPTLAYPPDGSPMYSDLALQWNSVPGAFVEYLASYSTDSTFSTAVGTSGWTVGTWWYPTPGPGTYYWRVQARNSATLATGPTSSTWSFIISDGCYGDSCCLYGCSTCPTLYSWDGSTYAFETDTFPTGFLGTKTATGWRKPNPFEYHLLENAPQLLNGSYNLKIVEERDETDYFDTLKLYTVDYPLDRDIYQELRTAGTYAAPEQMIHTVEKTLKRPASILHVNTGEDVSAKLASSDGDHLVLNTDRNIDFNWNTLEIDLGDQSSAPQIKLIIDAEMVVPTTSAGMARKTLLAPNGKITRLEVLDANGNWTLVPYTVKEIFSPKERSNAYIVDITNIFTVPTYKFRLSFLYKVYVDAIFFDTSLDVPVTVTELPLLSATLGYYGFSEMTEGELFDYIYGSIVDRNTSYFSGMYTKYGDVTPLLTQTDDKFVIFAGGEEVDARFAADSQPPVGKARRYLVYANGYYKATGNVDIPHTVEPLPFRAMSNYPYDPAVESYPTDADHNLYRAEYNTRLH